MNGTILEWPAKHPQEVLDYSLDWSTWLESGDTISSINITPPSGVTKTAESNNTTSSTVWLSGGTAGQVYDILHVVTTAEARTGVAIVRLPVK